MNGKTPHILGTASNLFGISAVLITGIHLSNLSVTSFFDEVVLASAFMFFASCVLSYLSIRNDRDSERYEQWADYIFLSGLFVMFIALLLLTASIL